MSTSLLEKRLPDGARHADEYADVPELVAELRALPAESDEFARRREQIVLRCCPLADRLAATVSDGGAAALLEVREVFPVRLAEDARFRSAVADGLRTLGA